MEREREQAAKKRRVETNRARQDERQKMNKQKPGKYGDTRNAQRGHRRWRQQHKDDGKGAQHAR